MQYKGLLITIAVLSVVTVSSAARTEYGPTSQQDAIRLETRINQLEQRLYTIDSSLRNLEQQSRLAGTSGRVNPEDVARLRLDIQALQQRLALHECALAKLDERTLSAAMRAERRRSGSGGANDPCRLNFDTPVPLTNVRDD